MKRTSVAFTGLLLIFVWVAVNPPAGAEAINNPPIVETRASRSSPQSPSLTIIFRGLMVFRLDQAQQYFEVGAIKAPEHLLRIHVLENSAEGVSTFSVPVLQSEQDVWSVEFSGATEGISFYQNGPFDRKSGVGDERDFRWAINLRGKEFYDRTLQADGNQLGVVLRVRNGELYSNKRTRPLMRKKGDGTFEFFGRSTQEIATDGFLEAGDMVLRSEKSGTEILRLKHKPGTTYEVIIDNAASPQEHMTVSANHFQYYYRLFGIMRAGRYEFKPASRALSSKQNDSERWNHIPAKYVSNDAAPCMPVGW